jgi:hypothetical protein
MTMASAERASHHALRPRNVSVPSYRPMHSSGCTACVRPLVAGSGEGQHTCTVRDSRRL